MRDDSVVSPIIITIFVVFISICGIIMGSEISEQGNINEGRKQGIVLCSEKPEECKIEYTYLKLKENQKQK